MDPQQHGFMPGQFPGYGFGYGYPDNGFPGAPPMGSFSSQPVFPPTYQHPPSMPQSSATPLNTNDPNNAPPFAQNVQTNPTAGHPYYQAYGMDPRQPFSMQGYIPASPHSSTIPSVPYHVPIQTLNPYQRVAMAEQFAKSSNAPGAVVPPNVAGYSPAPEHLTPGSRISSDSLATKSAPYDMPPNQPAPPVQKPAGKDNRPYNHRPNRSRGVRKFAGHISSEWLENLQRITKYEFRDPDILEEALESPGSGIKYVGKSCRKIGVTGNKRIAAVGSRVMKLVLMDHCYDAGIDYNTTIALVDSAIADEVLCEIASTTELERFIHRSKVKGVGLSNQQAHKAAVDLVTQAVKAVIGAVYVDSGRDQKRVKEVMEYLGLMVKEGQVDRSCCL